MDTIKPYTPEEIRQKLYSYLKGLCAYWSNIKPEGSHNTTEKERMEGLCFSILVMFDGGTCFPAMDIRMSPHESDKQYLLDRGERYYEPGMLINDCSMHDEFYAEERKKLTVGKE